MKRFFRPLSLCLGLILAVAVGPAVIAQEQSVKPGVNKSYERPNIQQQVKQLEHSNRDVVEKLDEIVEACRLEPGLNVADVGAGTGLFARAFASKVAPGGKVYAVDITKTFVDYIEKTCREKGIENVECVLSLPASAELPAASVDRVFICSTYHHFEYPYKMLASIHQAMRPGGRLIIIDFKKQKGVSPDWVFGHVRADKKTVVEEITRAGFRLIDELDLIKQQYLVRFEKAE